MWVGVPRNTSVCVRCQFRINRPISPPTAKSVLSRWQSARIRSTAAAVVQDLERDAIEPQKPQRPSKRSKKGLRHTWKPPRVAELGVWSMGKPAEVLVLKDRDRHVLAAAADEAERYRAAEPRILEALHAENLPLSSESVKQSLDQIRLPYQSMSKALTAKDRTDLTKKLMDGFTQYQLQSYCLEGDGSNLAIFAGILATDGGTERQTVGPIKKIENLGHETIAPKVLPRLRKAVLVKYIVKQKWALSTFDDEHAKQPVSVSLRKLEYMLNLKQVSLETYATELKVTIEASRGGRSINVTGKLQHVRAAYSDIQDVLERMETLRVRSVTVGSSLKRLATQAFLDQVSRTHNVIVDWASNEDEAIEREKDWLTVCSSKSLDPQNALCAERAVLLRERDFVPIVQERPPQEIISMWLSKRRIEPDLIMHQAPVASSMSSRQNAWSRWTIPQLPTRTQLTRSGSSTGDKDEDAVSIVSSPDDPPRPYACYMSASVGFESSGSEAAQRLTSINKESVIISKFLKGANDEFFFPMHLKQQRAIRVLIKAKQVQEEIFAEFGKILFSHDNAQIRHAFSERSTFKMTEMLSMKRAGSTLTSLDVPFIPNYLRSLSPLDETEFTRDDMEKKKGRQNYRLRYIPVSSELPPGFAYPTLEIDISRKGKPGSVVTNHITGAWAILDEQRHKLLTPLFALDLDFVRRLKRQLLFQSATEKDKDPGKTTWLDVFGEQIWKLDSEHFPPFLQATLPEYSVKSIRPQHSDIAENRGPKDVGYLLESWNLVHSTTFRSRHLCLEHLHIEGMTSDESRELLRLATQPLFDNNIRQTVIPILLERAFKVAAHMSDPRLLNRRDEPDPSALEKADSNAADRETAQ